MGLVLLQAGAALRAPGHDTGTWAAKSGRFRQASRPARSPTSGSFAPRGGSYVKGALRGEPGKPQVTRQKAAKSGSHIPSCTIPGPPAPPPGRR